MQKAPRTKTFPKNLQGHSQEALGARAALFYKKSRKMGNFKLEINNFPQICDKKSVVLDLLLFPLEKKSIFGRALANPNLKQIDPPQKGERRLEILVSKCNSCDC